jgi:hypothetical protein
VKRARFAARRRSPCRSSRGTRRAPFAAQALRDLEVFETARRRFYADGIGATPHFPIVGKHLEAGLKLIQIAVGLSRSELSNTLKIYA